MVEHPPGRSITAERLKLSGLSEDMGYLRRFVLKSADLYQDAVSTIGYRLYGIEFISRRLERADSERTLKLLRSYGAHLGDSINFKGGIVIDNASKDRDSTNDFRNLTVGNNCYIGKNVFFDLPNQIRIEDEAVIGAGVSIYTHADCGRRVMGEFYPRKTGPVVIGRGAWIGANAIILCDIRIGEKCVVAAGSVVTRSFGPNEVVAGVPAKKIGKITEKEAKD